MQSSREPSPLDSPETSEIASASASVLEQGDTPAPVLKWGGQRRFKFFVTGVVGPIACFVMAGMGMNARVDPLWQSGKLETYLTLMLEFKPLLPFLPLLILSMISLGACCVQPELGRNPLVRFGVYSGGLLSAQYLMFVVVSTSFFTFFAALFVGPGLALVTYLGAKLMPRARRITIWQIMLLTTVVAVIVALLSANLQQLREAGPRSALQLVLTGLFFMLIAAPLLNCLTYVQAAFTLLRSPALVSTPKREVRSLFALAFGWLVAFGASWKFSLDAMLAEYATLPTSPPNCYISSAAAYGHQRFVGVDQFQKAHGAARNLQNAFPVNEQMCRLKFLEFALAATSPRVHRIARRAYNTLGPKAAAFCRRSVWLADASYVAFKPVEWLAEGIRRAAGISARDVRRLYIAGYGDER